MDFLIQKSLSQLAKAIILYNKLCSGQLFKLSSSTFFGKIQLFGPFFNFLSSKNHRNNITNTKITFYFCRDLNSLSYVLSTCFRDRRRKKLTSFKDKKCQLFRRNGRGVVKKGGPFFCCCLAKTESKLEPWGIDFGTTRSLSSFFVTTGLTAVGTAFA